MVIDFHTGRENGKKEFEKLIVFSSPT